MAFLTPSRSLFLRYSLGMHSNSLKMGLLNRRLLVTLLVLHFAAMTLAATSFFTSEARGTVCSIGCVPSECPQETPCQVPTSPISPPVPFDLAFYPGTYTNLFSWYMTASPSGTLNVYLATNGTHYLSPSTSIISRLQIFLSSPLLVNVVGLPTTESSSRTQLVDGSVSVALSGSANTLNVSNIAFTNNANAVSVSLSIASTTAGINFEKCSFFARSGFIFTVPTVTLGLPSSTASGYIPTITATSCAFNDRVAFGMATWAQFSRQSGIHFTDCTFNANAPAANLTLSAPVAPSAPVTLTRTTIYSPGSADISAFIMPRNQSSTWTVTGGTIFLGGSRLYSGGPVDQIAFFDVELNGMFITPTNDQTNITLSSSTLNNGSSIITSGTIYIMDSTVDGAGVYSSDNMTFVNSLAIYAFVTPLSTLTLIQSNFTDLQEWTSTLGGAPGSSFWMENSFIKNPPKVIILVPFYIANSTIVVEYVPNSRYFQIGAADTNIGLSGTAIGLTVISSELGGFQVSMVTFELGSSITTNNLRLLGATAYFGSLTVSGAINGLMFSSIRATITLFPDLMHLPRQPPSVWTFYSIPITSVSVNTSGITQLNYFHSASTGIVLGPDDTFAVHPFLPLRIVWASPNSAPQPGTQYSLLDHAIEPNQDAIADWTPSLNHLTPDPYVFNATASIATGIRFQMVPPLTVIIIPPNAGTVTIIGNVTTSVPITFSGGGSTLVLNGCAIEVSGGIVYNFADRLPNGTLLALVQNPDCPNSLQNIPISVNAPKKRSCEQNKAQRAPGSTDSALYVIFLIDDSKCNHTTWIIVGSVLGVLLAVGIITTIVAVHLVRKKNGSKATLAKLTENSKQ